MNEHEQAVVNAFIEPSRQERFLAFLADPKKRHKFTDELCHLRPLFFNRSFLVPVTGSQNLTPNLYKTLKAMGAPECCWVIGGRLDGQEIDLMKALQQAASRDGVLISCIPGRLAYVESELHTETLNEVGTASRWGGRNWQPTTGNWEPPLSQPHLHIRLLLQVNALDEAYLAGVECEHDG